METITKVCGEHGEGGGGICNRIDKSAALTVYFHLPYIHTVVWSG